MSMNENDAPVFKLTPVSETNSPDVSNIATEEQVSVAKQEFEKELNGLRNHKFLIRLDAENIQNLLNFIENDAKWKFRNAYGIVECFNEVGKAKELSIKEGTDGIYLDNITLEALAYFLHQHEGVGLATAKSYIGIIDPVFEAMQEASKWKNKIESLRKKYILLEDSFEQQIAIETVNLEAIENAEEETEE